MSDETLYRQYRRMFILPRLRRNGGRGFALFAFFAVLLLSLAIGLDKMAGLPGWIVPAGILAGAMGTVAVERWNLTLPGIGSKKRRVTIFDLVWLVGIVWSPLAVCAIFSSYALGLLLALWVQVMDPLAEKEPDRPLDA